VISDDTAPAAFGEDGLRLYLGANPGPYVAFWERARASGHPFVWSWNWWGLLFPLPWLFYRKIWAVGAAVVLLPVLLDTMIGFGAKAGFVFLSISAIRPRVARVHIPSLNHSKSSMPSVFKRSLRGTFTACPRRGTRH